MSSGWGWGSVFGGRSTSSKDTVKSAILGLRSTLEVLNKRERHLQNQMEEQEAIARKNVAGNKNLAKAALRRKKNFEHQLEQTQAQMLTVEREISTIESANINKETLDAMKQASKALTNINGGLTIDKVDETMERLRDQHTVSEEIAEAITQGNALGAMDEDELDEALAEMQQEELDNKMLKTGSVPVADGIHRLPNAVSGELTTTRRQTEEYDEEEELRKLQADMAM